MAVSHRVPSMKRRDILVIGLLALALGALLTFGGSVIAFVAGAAFWFLVLSAIRVLYVWIMRRFRRARA
jgi:hypothetical protein